MAEDGRGRAELSPVQRILRFLMPRAAFSRMELESRSWLMACGGCGHAVSYWDAGGIRYGAWSRGKRVAGRCPKCGRMGSFSVRREG